ncbi:Rha family transcriptional regulator [Bacillus sp. FSL W7-1360]
MKWIQKNGQLLVDSRDLAEMIGKRHDHLLRDIDRYKEVLGKSTALSSDSFFQASTYQAGAGKNYKHYLLTRKGCDMVVHKLTGKKGIEFSAVYVAQLEEMEKQLQTKTSYKNPQKLVEALRSAADAAEENNLFMTRE